MVKFDEINEDNIKDMSLEDLQEVALSGKTELMGARGVIWDLNKKIKNPENWENGWEFNEEKFNEFHTKKQKQEQFNDFLNEHNLDEDQKKQANDYFGKGLSPEEIAKLTWVTSFGANQNNSNRMNVWGWEAWAGQLFEWKLSYWDFNQLDKAWKEAYKSFSRGKFWGLSFDRSSRSDD